MQRAPHLGNEGIRLCLEYGYAPSSPTFKLGIEKSFIMKNDSLYSVQSKWVILQKKTISCPIGLNNHNNIILFEGSM